MDGRRVSPLVAEVRKTGERNRTDKRGLEINARTAGASKNIEVEVDKPLGLTLGQKPGGGVIITVSSTSRDGAPFFLLVLLCLALRTMDRRVNEQSSSFHWE